VLDAGCGTGSFFRKFGRSFGSKTGVDHSAQMLALASARCRGLDDCRWLRASVLRLPASLRGGADLVVCANVLTFVPAATCVRALRQVAGASRRGGWLLLVLPALESHDAVVALETGRPQPARGDSAVVRRDDRMQRFYTAAGARGLAARAGLHAITVRRLWYPWRDEGILRPPPGRSAPWDWLVTARR
jgi:ubiquinone/menaquinone biosynthesis C-methylase UbiE